MYQKNYFAGQDYCDESEFDSIEKNLLEGLDMFENIFGFKSLSFTSQGGFWGDHILPTLANHGVIFIGGRQFHPNLFSKHKILKYSYWFLQIVQNILTLAP